MSGDSSSPFGRPASPVDPRALVARAPVGRPGLAERDAEILAASKAGNPPAAIARRFKLTRAVVYNVLKLARRVESAGGEVAVVRPQGALALYEAMVSAIAAAKAVDEAKDIVDRAEAMRVYARQAKNREAEIDAAEIRIRAERRIGELISDAKAVGQVAEGRPSKTVASDDSFSRVTLKDAGIDRDLSSRAQKLAAMPADEFAWQLSGWRDKAKEEGARVTVRLLKGDAARTKAEARAVKEEILGRQILRMPDKRYGVILADPEWQHVAWSESGMLKAASNHYPVSSTDEIAARPVADIAAPDCILFLWAIVPMLPDALRVMQAWGFGYKSHLIWEKEYPGAMQGLGYWSRINHELLLIGMRGRVPAPTPGTQPGSIIKAPFTGRHSEKPEIFLELIEDYFPTLPKIELNRRGPARAGWSAWGNEVEESQSESQPGQDPEHGEQSSAGTGLASRLAAGRTAAKPEETGGEGKTLANPAPPAPTTDAGEIPAFLRRDAA